jgi:uncharacterized protein (DUF3084 family)
MELTGKRITEIKKELQKQKNALKSETSFIEMLEAQINDLIKVDASIFSYTEVLNHTTAIATKKAQIKSSNKRAKRHEIIIESLETTLKYT